MVILYLRWTFTVASVIFAQKSRFYREGRSIISGTQATLFVSKTRRMCLAFQIQLKLSTLWQNQMKLYLLLNAPVHYMYMLGAVTKSPKFLYVSRYSDVVASQLSYYNSQFFHSSADCSFRHQLCFQHDTCGNDKFSYNPGPVIRQKPLEYTIRDGPEVNKYLGDFCCSHLLRQYHPCQLWTAVRRHHYMFVANFVPWKKLKDIHCDKSRRSSRRKQL